MIEELIKNAENGGAEAQLALGHAYYCGNGIERDCKEAAKWYALAAEQGNAEAQYYYGICYEHGDADDRIRNYGDAFKQYEKSAAQGYAPAQARLSQAYYEGKGTKINIEKAAEWAKSAAEQGNAEAMLLLAKIYCVSDNENERAEAFELLQKTAAEGTSEASYYLAKCYENGIGTKVDYDKAIELYRGCDYQFINDKGRLSGAEKMLCALYAKLIMNREKEIRAKYRALLAEEKPNIITDTAYILSNGEEGVKTDKDEGNYWFRTAADKGDAEAYFALGYRYTDENSGLPVDYDKAIEHYKIAAEKGNARAVVELAYMYYSGEFIPKNYDEAIKWCEIAYSRGDKNILGYAAEIYAKRRNYKEAIRCYKSMNLISETAKTYADGMHDKKIGKEEKEELRREFEKESSDIYFQYASLFGIDSDIYWEYVCKAAEMGNKDVIELLVKLYEHEDITEKLKGLPDGYAAAAENGNEYAMYALGFHYANGYGVVKDVDKAMHWYELSAAKKYAPAVRALNATAKKNRKGSGFEDKIKACRECGDDDELYDLYIKCYSKTDGNGRRELIRLASEEDTYLIDKLGRSLLAGTDVYDLDECKYFKRDLKDAYELFKAGADKNSNESKYYLGCCYDFGIGVDKDVDKAMKLYAEASEMKSDIENGNRAAMIALGYWARHKAEPDETLSDSWYEQAAEAEDDIEYDNAVYACETGSSYHCDEDDEDCDFGLAWKYYLFAMESGVTDAYVNMADLYENGSGVPKNIDLAVRLNMCAAEAGNAVAQCNIGEYYYKGYIKGIDKAETKRLSKEWFKKSAENGCDFAEDKLGELFGITDID